MNEKTAIAQRPMKSPGLAGFLSAWLPFGVGALYNEQRNKALLQFIIFWGLIVSLAEGGSGVVFGLGIAGFYFYQLFDNIQSARAINAAAAGQKPGESTAAPAPLEDERSGSVFWGTLLIVLGVCLILANFEILPYRYWPIAVIAVGLKFVFDATKSKKDK